MIETLRTTYEVFVPKGQRKKWLGLIVLAVVLAGAEALTALLIFRVFGFASEADSVSDTIDMPFGVETTLVPLLFATGVVFVLRGLLNVLSVYAQARIVQSSAAAVAALVHRRYLQAPYRFHLTRSSSESLRTVLWSVDMATTTALNPIISLITAGLMSLMLFVLLVGIAPTTSIVAAVVLGGGIALVLAVVQPRLGRLGKRGEVTAQQLLASVRDSFDSVRDIKTYRAEDFFDARFRRHRNILAKLRTDKTLLDQIPTSAVEYMVVLGLLVVIGVAANNSTFSEFVPVLGVFGYAALRIVPAVNRIVAGANRLKYGEQAVKNVKNDLDAAIPETLPEEHSTEVSGPLFNDRIELENITFTYPGGERRALERVGLAINRGEILAVAGGSGSGKSTLVDVVLGLLEPDSGRIVIDGSDSLPAGWHRKVGIVSQTVVLLDASVRDNVAFGNIGDADDELVIRALKRARLGEWVESLPDGLDSMVGESGKLVSGGERQRIAIARSLYRGPELLILDEATSALDGATEASLLEELVELSGDLTTIIVSHRIAPIRAADRIALMHDGKIAAVGSYDELVESSGEFRDLVGK